MAIIIDLILLALILLSTYLGYRKGLIGVAFKIVSFIIAIIITLILFKPVSNLLIEHTQIDESIETFILEKFATSSTTEQGEMQQEESNLPSVVVHYINTMVKDAVETSKDAIIQSVSHELTINIIHILTMIAIFIITRVLLFFAKAVLQLVAELPIVKQCNEIGGIIYGILRGILVIYLVFAILSFLLPVINQTEILTIIHSSLLGSILYNNNLILMIFF